VIPIPLPYQAGTVTKKRLHKKGRIASLVEVLRGEDIVGHALHDPELSETHWESGDLERAAEFRLWRVDRELSFHDAVHLLLERDKLRQLRVQWRELGDPAIDHRLYGARFLDNVGRDMTLVGYTSRRRRWPWVAIGNDAVPRYYTEEFIRNAVGS
jgi:hypothetical protein